MSTALRLQYPYEEFADHIKAMRTVQQWEYTSRFGQVGHDQTSRANCARVLEYFWDCYTDHREALAKAEMFLSIYDYIGRHSSLFAKKELMERSEGSFFSVESALLRAVHYLFTAAARPGEVDPKMVLSLAKAFRDIEQAR
ncbi:MAG TPA: hypothetical protein VL361_22760 [Candidatus Limnocylindrales bacterium]|jgi:hypothetical protein|nr:hypothetical protein [Candidatus Limnocylindrales bacterium]